MDSLRAQLAQGTTKAAQGDAHAADGTRRHYRRRQRPEISNARTVPVGWELSGTAWAASCREHSQSHRLIPSEKPCEHAPGAVNTDMRTTGGSAVGCTNGGDLFIGRDYRRSGNKCKGKKHPEMKTGGTR